MIFDVLEAAAPLALFVGDEVHQSAGQPGDELGQEDRPGVTGGVGVAAGEVGQQIGQRHPDHDGGEEGDPHGGGGVAGAPHHAAHTLGDGESNVARGQDAHHQGGHLNKLRGVGEQAHKGGAEEDDTGHQQSGGAHCQSGARFGALTDPVNVAGAHVLAGEGGHGVAEGKVGHHHKAVDAHHNGVAGHKGGAEGVCEGLDHQTGAGHDCLRQSGGQAQLHQLLGIALVQTEMLFSQVHHIPHGKELTQTETGGNELGDDGGDGHAGDPHAKLCHKKQVQSNVEAGGHDQVFQSAEGVAQPPKNAGGDVIKAHAGNSQEINAHIGHTHIIGLHRGVQQPQQGRGGQGAQHHHDEGGDAGEGEAGAHGVGQLLLLLGTEVLGHHDAGASGDAHKENNEQVQGGAASAHGGQSQVAHIFAHDHRVGGVVELLGDVADEQGNGEGDDFLPRGTLRHVLSSEKP